LSVDGPYHSKSVDSLINASLDNALFNGQRQLLPIYAQTIAPDLSILWLSNRCYQCTQYLRSTCIVHMTCCRSEEQQHNTRPGEHHQHNSSNKSGEQQHSSSSRSGEQQHPSNSIAEERQHLNSSRVDDHRLHHHHINRKSIRFTRDVVPEEDRNESAAGIRIHIQVRRVYRDPAGVQKDQCCGSGSGSVGSVCLWASWIRIRIP
jgi:hypothetical protein